MEVTDERHLSYLIARGVQPSLPTYATDGDHLLIRYRDHEGNSYLDCKGRPYVVRRLFPTGKPKFKAPPCSGSRPYFSPLMPPGQLNDIRVPLVLIEGPVKVDALYSAGITGFCFVGLTGTWNIRDRRDENGTWNEENDTRLLPELKAIPMRSRQVICLFDSDIEDNISVDAAAKAVGNMARSQGGRPFRCLLPSETDGQKNGADDYVVRHGAEALVERLEEAEIEGWPLPASLLDKDGELKRSYTPSEFKRVTAALADVQDIQTVDLTCRALASKVRVKHSELLASIDDIRAGTSGEGFLGSAEDLEGDDDLDSNWEGPYLLPREETIVLSADPGVGKSLFSYSLAYAKATGGSFLGFPIPKGVPLLLQLEEGGTFKRRMKAIGFAQSDACNGLEVAEQWFFSKTFDLAKPRHIEQLKWLIRNNVDLVIVDSARAVARSLAVDENHADFGKLVIRKIARLINDCGKSGVIIHHNNGAGRASGTKDIPAGVWGVMNLKAVEGQPTQRTLNSDKLREGDGFMWQLGLNRKKGADGSADGWEWTLQKDLSHQAPDLSHRERFQNLLKQQDRPIDLRTAGELIGLSDREFDSFRRSVQRDRACMRWAQGSGQGKRAMFWMGLEMRGPGFSVQPGLISDNLANLDTNPENGVGVARTLSHPIYETGKSVQVTPNPLQEQDSELGHNLDSVEEVPDSKVSKLGHSEPKLGQSDSNLDTKGGNLFGVCVSPLPVSQVSDSVSLRLNGHRQQVLDLIAANPGLIAAQYANKIQATFGIPLSGQQVKALIDEQRQNTA